MEENNRFNYKTRIRLSKKQRLDNKYIFKFNGDDRIVEFIDVEFHSRNMTIEEVINNLKLDEIEELWIQKM